MPVSAPRCLGSAPIPDQSCLHRVAGQRASQWWFRRVGRVTRWSLPGQAQGVHESNEGMMLWDLLPSDSTDNEDRCHMSGTDNETDQLNGLGVTPLQIVDDQQTRAVASQPRSLGLQHRTADGAEPRRPTVSVQLAGKRRGVRAGDERALPSRPCQACRYCFG